MQKISVNIDNYLDNNDRPEPESYQAVADFYWDN
ncbi:hypothetical protein HMPREF9715_02287 [Myroides odoratimimus CIP 101113]|uniref:Uncharacterized protein n=1 Tax=Myroides odoratimimus CIP 101113 TaxID=883154 RepID=A0AAV3F239_9FLAO|nr:hypothetical protein HMPREF9715_02287 [Myroides odoratimimus CIP 101113]